ncbi:hypothetical protein QCE62_00555 [Caballeronia sp. LZ033]|nr:hypothetical protein [Caballeronia sp. LZ033]MDR5812077.1 hypothetical protein [Caballeronia sp. LZ033]
MVWALGVEAFDATAATLLVKSHAQAAATMAKTLLDERGVRLNRSQGQV